MKKSIMLILGTVLLIIDQITKYMVYGKSINIINNFFSIEYSINTGAAFSLFTGKTVFLIIISIIMLYYIIKEFYIDKSNINLLSLCLIIAGTLGNLIDRIFKGYVVDFLSFKIFGYYFPIFNCADVYIVCGAIILLIRMFFKENINESK